MRARERFRGTYFGLYSGLLVMGAWFAAVRFATSIHVALR
jgi:hypothetical protein